MIEIKQVHNKRDLTKFIDFPHDLYSGDENYVPELFIAQEDLLGKKHPFFHHSEADYFLAYIDNKIVGRIAAIKNNNYIAYTGDLAGSFGFFDVIQDYEVAKALFDRVVEWLKERGLNKILGPNNYSTNETCGALIEGFDSPPTVMMPYNKPYYIEFLDRYGFEKDMDLLSYKILTKDVPQKLLDMAPKILERLNKKGIAIRKLNMKKFDQEVDKIIKIYNAAWEKNWGFVPMTDEEFKHAAKDMKKILDSDFLLIAEHQGQPIGFSLSIPDMNVPLKHLKRGRLLPFGIFKLLYYKNNIDRVRIVTLGIIEGYRKMGIDAYFYTQAFEEAKKKKMLFGEASWILENNEIMNKALININGQLYKKHRLYKKSF
jgi:GNAT superfamily N-acetyltransferase